MINNKLVANIYYKTKIAIIDLQNAKVERYIEFKSLFDEASQENYQQLLDTECLNGIAYFDTRKFKYDAPPPEENIQEAPPNFKEKFHALPDKHAQIAFKQSMYFCTNKGDYKFKRFYSKGGYANYQFPIVKYQDYSIIKVKQFRKIIDLIHFIC